ncbi:MAG: DUF2207 domain-containing protein [Clostridiales bacterium]|nr:DUF2207 domain-containing protein [Clostridiales bacterium]
MSKLFKKEKREIGTRTRILDGLLILVIIIGALSAIIMFLGLPICIIINAIKLILQKVSDEINLVLVMGMFGIIIEFAISMVILTNSMIDRFLPKPSLYFDDSKLYEKEYKKYMKNILYVSVSSLFIIILFSLFAIVAIMQISHYSLFAGISFIVLAFVSMLSCIFGVIAKICWG